MSELAFDLNGEPIAFPAEAEELRVRRFRNPGMRGACEVVHDRDGAPLYVPVDIEYVEFRQQVGGAPGRYRLDPCDQARRVIANSTPAYITITETQRNAAPAGSGDDRDSVIQQLARTNAEMAKTIAEGFAGVMQAAAELIRAADGAGLPRRQPPPPPPEPEPDDDDDDDEDEDDDDLEDDEEPQIAAILAQALPLLQMWITTKAAEKAAAVAPAAAPPPTPVPAPAPAPAAAPSAGAGEAGAAAGPEDAGPAPAAVPGPTSNEPPTSAPTTGAVEAMSGPGSAQTSAPSGAAPAGAAPAGAAQAGGPVRNAGLPTAAQAAHLMAIHARLTPTEKRITELVATRMPPDVRAEWLVELSALTVEQAVDLVRSMIPKTPSRKEGEK